MNKEPTIPRIIRITTAQEGMDIVQQLGDSETNN